MVLNEMASQISLGPWGLWEFAVQLPGHDSAPGVIAYGVTRILTGRFMMVQGDSSHSDREQNIWLVNASLLLAVALEVFPVEDDLICGPYLTDVPGSLAVKVTCLAVIISPLVIFFIRDGWAAWSVWGRVTAIVTIVAVSLVRKTF